MAHTFTLTEELLLPVVREALSEPTAKVETFELKALKPGVGNPTSLGVYRASGTASVGEVTAKFSVVVKHLADGQGFMDASQPTHWNYYKREIDFFESAVAKRIPAKIGMPKYLGKSSLTDGTWLFWNEDLGDITGSKFTWAACIEAAELVAELNSIDISDASEHKWLGVGTPTGWLDFRDAYFIPPYLMALDLVAEDPVRTAAFENYGKYLGKQFELVELMGKARQTFVHGDFNLNNLVYRPGQDPEVIALDWQLCGVAAVGSEVVAIFGTAIEHGIIEISREHFDTLCLAYVNRFNQLNDDNPVTLEDVRLIAATMGYSIVCAMSTFFVWPDLDVTRELPRDNVEAMLDDFETGLLSFYASIMNELI